jgi:7-cyano-7-deazaguanine synthase in queuosine biosynthesis
MAPMLAASGYCAVIVIRRTVSATDIGDYPDCNDRCLAAFMPCPKWIE